MLCVAFLEIREAILDGQIGKDLIIAFDRVAAFGQHGGYQQLRSRDGLRRSVNEPLL